MITMATLQCRPVSVTTHSEEKQVEGQWSSVFPPAINTATESLLFVKKLVAIGISSITYLRVIFPERAYRDVHLEGLNLKILRDESGCPGAESLISWIKGCFDAVEKKYLRQMTLAICIDPNDPETALETYTFRFSYTESGETSVEAVEASDNIGKHNFEVKKPTIKLLRTIIMLTQSLRPVPNNLMLSMKLLYYDEVTPDDYEPPGFKPTESESFKFSHETVTFKIGSVKTGFHAIKLRATTDESGFQDELKSVVKEKAAVKKLAGHTGTGVSIPRPLDNKTLEDELENVGNEEKEVKPLPSDFIRRSRMRQRSSRILSTSPQSEVMTQCVLTQENSTLYDEGYRTMNNTKDLQGSPNMNMLSNSLHDAQLVPTTPKRDVAGCDTPMATPKLDEITSANGSSGSMRTVNMSLAPTQPQAQYPVRCPCKVNRDQGLMILCDVCGFWQHGACFTILSEEEGPLKHYCNICADPPSLCTDSRLCWADSAQVEATCLYRRALVILNNFDDRRVTPANLAQQLGVNISVGNKIVEKMVTDNILTRGRSQKSAVVDRTVLLKSAYPRYLNKIIQICPSDKDFPSSLNNDTTVVNLDDSQIDSEVTVDIEGSVTESPLTNIQNLATVAEKNPSQEGVSSAGKVTRQTEDTMDSIDASLTPGESLNSNDMDIQSISRESTGETTDWPLFMGRRKRKVSDEVAKLDLGLISDSQESSKIGIKKSTPKRLKISDPKVTIHT